MMASAKIWQTLDLVCCTLFIYSSNFYGYHFPYLFFDSLKNHPESRSRSNRLLNMINREKRHLRNLILLILSGEKTQTTRMTVRGTGLRVLSQRRNRILLFKIVMVDLGYKVIIRRKTNVIVCPTTQK